MLMLKIANANRDKWHKSDAANPDDALKDLAHRGLYDFEAGDTLKKVVRVTDEDHGHKISTADDCE